MATFMQKGWGSGGQSQKGKNATAIPAQEGRVVELTETATSRMGTKEGTKYTLRKWGGRQQRALIMRSYGRGKEH